MTTLVIAASNGWHLAAEEVELAVEWWPYAERAFVHSALMVACGEPYVDRVGRVAMDGALRIATPDADAAARARLGAPLGPGAPLRQDAPPK